MNGDDMQRGGGSPSGNRMGMMHKYGDNKGPNYSPSASYNYNNRNSGGYQQQQQVRRRNDRYRRNVYNFNDKIVKQNDLIIRLLKEIRDRLPEPQVIHEKATETDADYFNGAADNGEKEQKSSFNTDTLQESGETSGNGDGLTEGDSGPAHDG